MRKTLIIFFIALSFGLVAFASIKAGSLDSLSAPGKTMKTLEDIYCKYAGCTPASFTIDSPATATTTMHTLQQVYDAVIIKHFGRGWIPNPSGSGSIALTQANCQTASPTWQWFEDANGDGDTTDPEDGECVQAANLGATGSWNGDQSTTIYDNSYIAAYTCTGNFPTGSVATYSGIAAGAGTTADNTWNDGDCALCRADCYDGKKDLPGQGSWTSPSITQTGGIQGPITHEILMSWKGTRLPTAKDYFGFCGHAASGQTETGAGNGTYYSSGASSDKTLGSWGGNVGRGANGAPFDEYIRLSNMGSYEWLSQQSGGGDAMVAESYACSDLNSRRINVVARSRAVFRP